MENVEIHEGIQEDECWSSHWSQGKDYLAAHPTNPVVEAKHSHVYAQTAEDFKDDVINWINISVAAVVTAMQVEPDPLNKHTCAVVLGGYECP